MKLYSLIKNLVCRVVGKLDVEICGLYHKDTEVQKNGLFFCIHGTKIDGNTFVQSAIKNGAVAIVTEQEIHNLFAVSQIVVKNAREAMSLIACKFYGFPAEKLKLIGVTGTNGKTTITNVIANVLNDCGKKCAVVGTNGVIINGQTIQTSMTTPDPIELQKYMSKMVKAKIEYVCMEVSAHAIDLKKIDGIVFDLVIFTNLSEDHLDYFKTMDRYFVAKSKLFTRKYAKQAIICTEDDYGKSLSKSINIPFLTYAINGTSNACIENVSFDDGKQKFSLDGKTYTTNLLGKFNVLNCTASILALELLGVDQEKIEKSLFQMQPILGRFNTIVVGGRYFVVDYAHSPDGLKNILSACREICNGKLICVFGCGGNREREKRPLMGRIASENADHLVITSDNPRFEKREEIINEIASGIEKNNFEIESDRELAIRKAFELSNENDFIVVAGKGAENYIDENGTKIHYSDYEVIEKIRR